ncbi:phospholipase D-like domain-containing protein [Psychrobacter sp. TWP2-1-2]|uniref:phospholipase D-like domain-containing protein n=1 Tax=Psychrobacter sp. TWP2-1-2 TaxID=2804623 RepID=UPI003CF7DB19
MLESGVTLFELRSQAASGAPADYLGAFRSSKASLHAKTFAVDRKRIFIGSFNFDPRSTALNIEMGLMINSEQMAQKLHKAFDEGIVGLTWRVEQRNGRLVWIDSYTGSMSVSEPGQSALRNIILTIVGWLPVEWLL